MSSAATEAEILAGVERWARSQPVLFPNQLRESTGWWNAHNGADLLLSCPWNLQRVDAAPVHSDETLAWGERHAAARGPAGYPQIWVYTSRHAKPGRTVEEWRLSPVLALAWALTVEAEPEPVDVGRCSKCVNGRQTRHFTALWHERNAVDIATHWTEGPVPDVYKDKDGFRYWRPCVHCSGTGRETVSLARLLLDAAQPCSSCGDTGMMGLQPDVSPCTDCAARQRLLAHADYLQAKGDPLGEVVGLALGPWADEPTEIDRHITTSWHHNTNREMRDAQSEWLRGQGWDVCEVEHEHKTEHVCTRLGHPGAAEALRWLERLTLIRQFMVERQTDPSAALPDGWRWEEAADAGGFARITNARRR